MLLLFYLVARYLPGLSEYLPFGGIDMFSCHVEIRDLPEEVYTEWKAGFDADQTGAYGTCASQHPRGSAEFWTCIDSAGISFPAA